MSNAKYAINPNQKKIISERAARKALIKEIDKAKKAQLGTDAWDARTDRYMGGRKYLNAVEVVARGSEAKKIDVTRKLIERLKGGDFEACDGLVAAVKGDYLNSATVKKLIVEYAKEFSESATKTVSIEDRGIRTVKNPNRKLPGA